MRRPLALFLSLAGLFLLPVAAAGDEIADAEELVSALYFEGVPFDAASRVTPEGAAHIAGMLDDPFEREHHATILEVLGICGQPGAYDAIAGYAAASSAGEVDGSEYRARLAVPIAMGHLARSDDRALAYLVSAAGNGGDAGWSYRHLDDAGVSRLLKELAIGGLGISGRAEAASVLRQMSASSAALSPTGPGGLGAHLGDALAKNARISSEGAAAVLGAADGGAR